MRILVAYATKHGSTTRIAVRIGLALEHEGHTVDVKSVEEIHDLSGYDAFILGSAVYYGHWRREATIFANRHRAELSSHPLWLFSSGPLGTETDEADAADAQLHATPAEFAQLTATLHPRSVHVFFGALDPNDMDFAGRVIRHTPAGKKMLPEGDFIDDNDIVAWAQEISLGLS
jgi:menaquinone-dependent protoporphyrinogen oxidase